MTYKEFMLFLTLLGLDKIESKPKIRPLCFHCSKYPILFVHVLPAVKPGTKDRVILAHTEHVTTTLVTHTLDQAKAGILHHIKTQEDANAKQD